ncbi:MAG: LPS export ABC transporter permease LptF [Nitrospirales bacterium]|nr:LPS export ABC transporter permease LptF [Nitrospira sp.]MDR4503155.1 LPS export ABC transporter permease LptF [Nitrospirales bacterium]
MMLLERYLTKEIAKPFFVICSLLVLMFVSFNWVRFLGRAVDAQLPTNMIFTLIMFKVIIALEVLLPVAMLLSIVLALGRLSMESEVTALSACGVSPLKIVKVVFGLALVLAGIVSALSLFIRPWAYQQSYDLEAKADTGFRISDLEAGRFYEREKNGGSLVLFMQKIDQTAGIMKHVFVQTEKNGNIRILSAKEARERFDHGIGKIVPVLIDGYEYKLSRQAGIDRITEFQELTLYPDDPKPPYYTRKAASNSRLIASSSPKEIAEFQWRLSTGPSTLLLALLGIPLSRATPRQGKYAKIFVAIVAFAVYYNLGAMAKTWVEQGLVNPTFPGIWWVNGLLLVALGIAYWPKSLFRHMRLGKVSVSL